MTFSDVETLDAVALNAERNRDLGETKNLCLAGAANRPL
jgi:hypothetical protein